MGKTRSSADARAVQRVALTLFTQLEAKASHQQRAVVQRLVGVGSAAFALLALVWVGGNLRNTTYQLQASQFQATLSDTQLQNMIESRANDYRLRIIRPDGTELIYTLQDLGMKADTTTSVAKVRTQQQSLSHRLQWWQPVTIKVAIRVDPTGLEAFAAQQASITVEPAKDATLAIVDGSAQVTEGVPGKQYGLDDPVRTIVDAASNLKSDPLRMNLINLPPTVSGQNLAQTKNKLESVLGQSVVLEVASEKVKPTRKEIAEWLTLAPDQAQKTVNIGVNPDKVLAWVNLVARTRSQPARAQIALGSGGVIPGTPGITVLGTSGAATTLTQDVLKGTNVTVELPVRQTAYKTINVSASGRWIEVDLTNKRLYAYEQSSLVRNFLVSAGAPATPTVTGTFAIYAKYSKQTMSGPNADGTSYVQPNVPWVNYFYRDFAIHGNYWRPASYFGNINSSHGCVGLRTADAAWLYSWASVGTQVVIHT